MSETDQLVLLPRVNCWNSLPVPVKFVDWTVNAIGARNFSPPTFAFTSLRQGLVEAYLERIQVVDEATYVRQADDEETVQNALTSLNQLFSYQADEMIEAFATYLSPAQRCVNGPWNGHRQPESVSSRTISPVPRDRQVRIETAAKDHVTHLETVILAEEQEAQAASAVGQMLISGGELWMRCKTKLLNSLSKYSRNRSTIGFQNTLANAVQASSY